MNKQSLRTGIAAALGMLILIIDGKTALAGMHTGLDLCLKAVIPSLFPYFILGYLLTGALSGISFPLLRPLGKWMGIPKGAESVLICAFLGGYPSGAQAVAQYHQAGVITKKDACRMLTFCSNAGPSFLFGMAASLFSHRWAPWMLWGIHIGTAFLTARMIYETPAESYAGTAPAPAVSAPAALKQAIGIMSAVCGWVVLFRVIIAFCQRWFLWAVPEPQQIVFSGFLEVANGCVALSGISSQALRFVLCSGMLAWGGVCVVMQTCSVLGPLPVRPYILGKIMQACLSLLLSGLLVRGLWMACALCVFFLLILSGKKQKNSSIPAAAGV